MKGRPEGWGGGPWKCLHPQLLVPHPCSFLPQLSGGTSLSLTSSPLPPLHEGNKGLNYVKCFHFHLATKVSLLWRCSLMDQQLDLSTNGQSHLEPFLLGSTYLQVRSQQDQASCCLGLRADGGLSLPCPGQQAEGQRT